MSMSVVGDQYLSELGFQGNAYAGKDKELDAVQENQSLALR